jgi:hypothetical protein
MVRTPSKLLDILGTTHHIPSELIETHLTIVQGNIKSSDDIMKTLTVTGHLPDKILFGVGGSPIFQFNIFAPLTLDDPHICEEGMKNIIAALRHCQDDGIPHGHSGSKPQIIAISTISMSNIRDMPYLYYPLEYWFLNIPRADKLALERVVCESAAEENSIISDFAFVRPPLLTDGPALGPAKVQAGWVWPDHLRKERVAQGLREAGPAIGWMITKADVGRWIFENLVAGGVGGFGRCWTLTN